MATQHGIPGEWARVRGTVLSLWPLFLSVFAMGMFFASLVFSGHTSAFAALSAVSLVTTALAWRKGLRRVESFFKGARGEEKVAGILSGLPEGWHVFHDFVVGVHHVDHVVVGPGGVFSVETKNWQNKVEVAEKEILVGGWLPSRPPLDQTRREAQNVLSALRSVGWNGVVTPVLCFASDSFAAGRAEVGQVCVVNAAELVSWLASLPVTFAPSEVERLVRLMETTNR